MFGSFLMSMILSYCETMLDRKSERFVRKAKEYIHIYAEGISSPFEDNKIQVDFNARWAFTSTRLKHGTFRFLGIIEFMVGLRVAAELGLMERLGGGWKKNVARKLISIFDENDYSGKFRDAIRRHWTQVEEFFNQAAAGLDKEWNDYVDNLRNTVKEYDIQEIRFKIEKLKCLSGFLENIPL